MTPDQTAPSGAHDVAAAYNRWSAQYDSDSNTTRDLDAEILRKHAPDATGKDVLELGCGTGKNTDWLSRNAQTMIAMDFSEGMLAVARERVRDRAVNFVQHDVRTAWPVGDASVDLLVGNLVLEHVEDLRTVYAEAARVLRPGGQLYFCELHPFRQLRGGQAHFTEQTSGEQVVVTAFVHTIGEYFNSGIDCGLSLLRVGEWLEASAPAGAPPRLFSVQFEK